VRPEEVISVVGIGADGWAGLGERSRALVSGAEVLVGGPRQLGLVPEGPYRKVPWPSPMLPGLDALFAEHECSRVCVLASGDPLVSGVGTTLVNRFGAHRLRIEPGVSSVALARARLGWPAEGTEVISVVGRDIHRIALALVPGRRLLVLSSDASSPAAVAALLSERGYGASPLTVLEELAGPAERRVDGVARDWPHPPGAALNVVAVECRADAGTRVLAPVPGLPDDAFEHDGQLTKRDLRAAALARLAPRPGELLWDVGAGAGSVGIEWSRAHPANRAVAIERDPARSARIRRNAATLGVPDLRVVQGCAPGVLDGLPSPDAVFVGGGLTGAGVLAECWVALPPGGRLVAHGVTLESEQALARAYAAHGGELVRIAVEHAAPLGGFTGWTPARTVTQWSRVKK
jgi:precorrin-6Y C5,15-methyltransferase (decarboxylating)